MQPSLHHDRHVGVASWFNIDAISLNTVNLQATMSQLQDMRIFAETVDAQSFTAAADRLGLSKQFVSKRIAALEQRLSAPMTFATMHLGPLVPAFMQRHPEVSLELELNDRSVDLIGEGYDMAVRIGTLADSTLIARRITAVQLITCASPDYLRQHGIPTAPEQLSAHACLSYGHGRRGEWAFRIDERTRKLSVSGPMRSNNGEMLRDAAIAGLGLINLPDFIVTAALADGRLVEVLETFRPAGFTVHAVYPQHRQSSLLVRAFSDFLVERFREAGAVLRLPSLITQLMN